MKVFIISSIQQFRRTNTTKRYVELGGDIINENNNLGDDDLIGYLLD